MSNKVAAWSVLVASLLLPDSLPAQTNAALDLLNEAIRFYASFDSERAAADLASGRAEPLEIKGRLTFVPGRFGKALVLGSGGGGAEVRYGVHQNLKLAEPGALSFWMAPQKWIQPQERPSRPYLSLVRLPAAREGKPLGGQLLIQRMGFSEKPKRNDALLAGFFGVGNLKDARVGAAGTLEWPALQWHLLVFNWDRNGIALSIDGGAFRRAEFSRPLRPEDFPVDGRSVFVVGSSNEETTLIDELTIYRRPLTAEEAQKLAGY